MKKVGVVVGRFQIADLHLAHVNLIRTVINNNDMTIVFVGISPVISTRTNPLDYLSIKRMIFEDFREEVIILPIPDIGNVEKWSMELDKRINEVITPGSDITLYGGIDSFIRTYTGKNKVETIMPADALSHSSKIREDIASKMIETSDFRSGMIYSAYNRFPTCYVTVDVAIFDKNNKVLMGRKATDDGWRFIGGFVDPNDKTFEDSAYREVYEETKLSVTNMKYLGSNIIDDWRYKRGLDKIKTIFFRANAFIGECPIASDDICQCKWIGAAEVKSRKYNIIDNHRDMWNLLWEKSE